MSKRRVVVTGLGMVSPLGLNVPDTWRAILEGQSGVETVTAFDTTGYSTRFSGSVKNFDPSAVLSAKDARKMDLFIQYGMVAAHEAITGSGLQVTEANAHRIGVAIGSGIGGLPMIEKNHQILLESGPRRISPFFIPSAITQYKTIAISIPRTTGRVWIFIASR